MQMRTSGGSSDTDENALAVIPYWTSSLRVVITLMPVANAPTASRKSRLVKSANPRGAATRPRSRSPAHALQPSMDDLVEVARRPERLRHELAEGVSLHREQRARLGRPDGGRPRRVSHDRHLAEEVALDRMTRPAAPRRPSSRTSSSSPSTTMKNLSAGPPWRASTSPASAETVWSWASMLPTSRCGRSVNTLSTSSLWYSTPNSSADRSPARLLSMNWSWVDVDLEEEDPHRRRARRDVRELLAEEECRSRDLLAAQDHLALPVALDPLRLAPVLGVLVDRE